MQGGCSANGESWNAVLLTHLRHTHTPTPSRVPQSFLSHASLCRQFGEVFGQARQLCALVARAGETGAVEWPAVQVSCRLPLCVAAGLRPCSGSGAVVGASAAAYA